MEGSERERIQALFLASGGAYSLRELRDKDDVVILPAQLMSSSELDSLVAMRRFRRRRSMGLGPACVVVAVRRGDTRVEDALAENLEPGDRVVIVDMDLLSLPMVEYWVENRGGRIYSRNLEADDPSPAEVLPVGSEGELADVPQPSELMIMRPNGMGGVKALRVQGTGNAEMVAIESGPAFGASDDEHGHGGSDAESTALSAESDGVVQCHICFSLKYEESAWQCNNCSRFICMRCLQRTWTYLTGDRRTTPDCPMCCEAVSDADIERVLGERGLKRVQYFRNVRKYADSNEVIFCAAEGCWAPISCEGRALVGRQVPIACDCGAETCGQCEQLWHPDSECAKPKMSSGVLMSRLWKFTHTKRCPQCGASIQKINGCSHMHCGNCGLLFCWTCKGVLPLETVGQRSVRRRKYRRRCICNTAISGIHLGFFLIGGALVLPVVVGGACVYVAVVCVSQTASKVTGHRRKPSASCQSASRQRTRWVQES